MEFIQNLLVTILLGIWAIGSITLVICLVQNFINDRRQEKREAARAERDSHIHCLLFVYDGIVGKLIPGDSAALFQKADNPLCIGIRLWNLIQGLFYKFLPKVVIVHIHRSFEVVFASRYRIFGFTNWRIM